MFKFVSTKQDWIFNKLLPFIRIKLKSVTFHRWKIYCFSNQWYHRSNKNYEWYFRSEKIIKLSFLLQKLPINVTFLYNQKRLSKISLKEGPEATGNSMRSILTNFWEKFLIVKKATLIGVFWSEKLKFDLLLHYEKINS